jgi:hypothetical protein
MASLSELNELRHALAEVRDGFAQRIHDGEFAGPELPYAKSVLAVLQEQLERADAILEKDNG